MSWSLLFTAQIPAVPVGQPRARAVAFEGRARMHDVTHIGSTKDGTRRQHPIVAFKATIRQVVQSVYQGPPIDGPIRVDLVCVFPRPKSMVWKRRPMPRCPHVTKPDRDNIDKAVLDALSKRTWRDDKQVSAGTIEKWIAAGDEQPHVLIRVSVWEEAESGE